MVTRRKTGVARDLCPCNRSFFISCMCPLKCLLAIWRHLQRRLVGCWQRRQHHAGRIGVSAWRESVTMCFPDGALTFPIFNTFQLQKCSKVDTSSHLLPSLSILSICLWSLIQTAPLTSEGRHFGDENKLLEHSFIHFFNKFNEHLLCIKH
jgi:hypothetical protein